MEIESKLVDWADNVELGDFVEWSEFCEAADLPTPRPTTKMHAHDVQERNAMRLALNLITREGEEPYELLPCFIEDPDCEEGEPVKVRALIKLGGTARLEARLHHHRVKVKNAPRNMLKELKRLKHDKTLSEPAKAKIKVAIKAAHVMEHFTARLVDKIETNKRLPDTTVQRVLTEALTED